MNERRGMLYEEKWIPQVGITWMIADVIILHNTYDDTVMPK